MMAFGRKSLPLFFVVSFLWSSSCATRHAPLLSPDELSTVETGSFAGDPPNSTPESFRLTAWNIDYGQRFPEILRVLETTLESDIFFLQEVDRFTDRTRNRETGQHRDIPRLLAEELKTNYAYGIEFQELKQDSPSRAAFTGQLTLSVFPLKQNQAIHFEKQLANWSQGLLGLLQKRHGGRMFLYSQVQIGTFTVHLYNAHLESRAKDHEKVTQIREILDHIQANLGTHEPVIIAGDLNTREGEESTVVEALLSNGFIDPFPQLVEGGIVTNRKDDRRLDWIFSRNLEPLEARVSGDYLGSDHRALTVTFKFPKEPPGGTGISPLV